MAIVAVQLHGMARRMDSPDEPAMFSGSLALEEVKDKKNLLEGSDLPHALQEFLGELNIKVDAILNAMTKETAQNDFPIKIKIHYLSGSGLILSSAEPIKPGEHLEIIIMLGQMPMIMVTAIGQVIKAVKIPGDKTGFSVQFIRIRTDHQDTLIQYVFQEERRQIREKKDREIKHR